MPVHVARNARYIRRSSARKYYRATCRVRSLRPYVITVITEPRVVLYGLVREARTRTQKTGRKPSRASVRAGMRLPLVSAFAEGTGMRVYISPLLSCPTLPETREDERKERGRAREQRRRVDTGNGIDSSPTRTCALARARLPQTRVCTRDLARASFVCARLCALASIKAVRCLPRRGRRDSNLLLSVPLSVL